MKSRHGEHDDHHPMDEDDDDGRNDSDAEEQQTQMSSMTQPTLGSAADATTVKAGTSSRRSPPRRRPKRDPLRHPRSNHHHHSTTNNNRCLESSHRSSSFSSTLTSSHGLACYLPTSWAILGPWTPSSMSCNTLDHTDTNTCTNNTTTTNNNNNPRSTQDDPYLQDELAHRDDGNFDLEDAQDYDDLMADEDAIRVRPTMAGFSSSPPNSRYDYADTDDYERSEVAGRTTTGPLTNQANAGLLPYFWVDQKRQQQKLAVGSPFVGLDWDRSPSTMGPSVKSARPWWGRWWPARALMDRSGGIGRDPQMVVKDHKENDHHKSQATKSVELRAPAAAITSESSMEAAILSPPRSAWPDTDDIKKSADVGRKDRHHWLWAVLVMILMITLMAILVSWLVLRPLRSPAKPSSVASTSRPSTPTTTNNPHAANTTWIRHESQQLHDETTSSSSSSSSSLLLSNDSYSRPTVSTQFGRAVDVHGNTLVVGAWQLHPWSSNDTSQGGSSSGVVHVYTRTLPENSDNPSWALWEHRQVLTPYDTDRGADFGVSVAIDQDSIIVGAYRGRGGGGTLDESMHFIGAAYIFSRPAVSSSTNMTEDWTVEGVLVAKDANPNDHFGISVDLNGDTAVVGSWGADSFNGTTQITHGGAAYVFVRYTGADNHTAIWRQHTKLVPTGAMPFDYFGYSVAIYGSWIAVSAPWRDSTSWNDAGAIYLFRYDENNDTWTEAQYWSTESTLLNSTVYLGYELAMYQGVLVAGGLTRTTKGGNATSGVAYVFSLSRSQEWQLKGILQPREGLAPYFGLSVDTDGQTIVVGAVANNNGDGFESGSSYVFARGSDGRWVERLKLMASSGTSSDQFANAVGVNNGTVVVGAWRASADGVESGTAYTYNLN